MGEPIKNWATHFVPSVTLTTLLDALPNVPANDTSAQRVPEYRWIHCSNEGEYRGHHQGPFELTRAVFEQMVRNFRASPQWKLGELEIGGGVKHTGGVRPVIQFDYEHASEMPPWEGTIPSGGAPAPGWVLDVELRDGADGKAQLWALAQLGPNIRRQIAAREYLWVSIAFSREAVHWVTGEPIGACLTSIAFTNHPFMADLEPLAAANRATSQPPRSAVRSGSERREEAPGERSPTATGATLEKTLRDRICKALNINLAASDEAVGEAVDKAVDSGSKLGAVLQALGVESTGDALAQIPKLRTALQQIEGVAKELRDLLVAEQTADAAVAQTDAAAAMSAQGATGDGIKKAFVAHRNHLVDEAIRATLAKPDRAKLDKQPAPLTIVEYRACVASARETFLKEQGVDPTKQHLTQTLVAGPGGAQITIDDRSTGSTAASVGGDGKKTFDLRGIEGRNAIEKRITQRRTTDKAFASLGWQQQVIEAGIELRGAEIQQ